MARGKNQNSQLVCTGCNGKHPMRYAFRINVRTRKQLSTQKHGEELEGIMKFCNNCRKHTLHKSKKITSIGSTKAK